MRPLFLAIVSALVLAFTGCGPGDKKAGSSAKTRQFYGKEYIKVWDSGMISGPETLAGNGAVLFQESGPKQVTTYRLSFTLGDGGSISLVTNTGKDLTRGTKLTFARNAKNLSLSSVSDVNKPLKLTGIDPEKPVNLSIDVQSNSKPAKILVRDLNQTGIVVAYNPGHADESESNNFSWGLILIGAQVLKAETGVVSVVE